MFRPIALAVLVATMGACQASAPPSATARPTTAASPKPTATPLAACASALAGAGPDVLKAGLPAPDDLAFSPDGRLLFSDIRTGTVSALGADGSVVAIAAGFSAPEGMVVAADGRLLVGEQGRNRVMALDLTSHAVSLWRAFPNRTGRDGLDGIGPLLPNGDIIVPDSPNGVVWRVTGDGKVATRIGSGMTRPVGAAVDTQGRIFVADEGGALWTLEPGQRRFATLQTPDDVLVGRSGHLFVNTLGDNAIHELDSGGHEVGVIRGIHGPQGIALDGADNLYYTEFDAGRIDRIVRTFVLDRATVTRTAQGTEVICPNLRRSAGFTDSLALTPGSSAATAIIQLHQPGSDSSGALEVRTSESTVTFSIGDATLNLSQTVSIP